MLENCYCILSLREEVQWHVEGYYMLTSTKAAVISRACFHPNQVTNQEGGKTHCGESTEHAPFPKQELNPNYTYGLL